MMAPCAGYPGGGFMRESGVRVKDGLVLFMIEKDEPPSAFVIEQYRNPLSLSLLSGLRRCKRA
jgi:hypothetical protein